MINSKLDVYKYIRTGKDAGWGFYQARLNTKVCFNLTLEEANTLTIEHYYD